MVAGSFEKSITLLLKNYWLIVTKLRYMKKKKINLSEDKKKNKILF